MALQLKIGDAVRLKKAHPCGGFLWTITRVGADIGLVCQKCGRYVLIPRSQLTGRIRRIVPEEQGQAEEQA